MRFIQCVWDESNAVTSGDYFVGLTLLLLVLYVVDLLLARVVPKKTLTVLARCRLC